MSAIRNDYREHTPYEIAADPESFAETYAEPYGLEGGTEGRDQREAAMMAAEWLRGEAEHWLMSGTEPPELPIGLPPAHGGRVILTTS